MMNFINKKPYLLALLRATFFVSVIIESGYAAGATRTTAATVAVPVAPKPGAAVAQGSAAGLTGQVQATKAAPSTSPVVALGAARSSAAGENTENKVKMLIERFVAARGMISKDIQAGLTTSPSAADLDKARGVFFAATKNLLTAPDLAAASVGYMKQRFVLKTFLELISAPTAATLANAYAVMQNLVGKGSGSELVAANALAMLSVSDFLTAADKQAVQAIVKSPDYANVTPPDKSYFAVAGVAAAAGGQVAAAKATQAAPAPAALTGPTRAGAQPVAVKK